MKNNIQFGHSEKAIVLGDGFLCDLNAARIADGGKPVKTQSQGSEVPDALCNHDTVLLHLRAMCPERN